jgi:tRNA(Arg) A34 adenosine deaminase TadA
MHEDFLRQAIELAAEGMRRGDGGPFGAVVVLRGEIIGRGWNRVLATNDPTAHAEVNALRDACALVKNHHLPGAIVYASCEPCPMCLGACYWAQAARIVYGATALDAAAAGFADDFIRRDVQLPPLDRHLPLEQLLHDAALAPFAIWNAKADRRVY